MRILVIASGVAIAAMMFSGHSQAQGEQIYQQNCAVCHGSSGGGASGPPLANNPNLSDTTHVLDQILNGGQAMPPFRSVLDDEQVAAVSTHIRTAWDNDFGEVTPEQSAAVRAGDEAGEAETQAQAGEAEGEGEADGEEGNQAETEEAAIAVADSRLVDEDGMTLYRYVYEAPDGEPLCYLNCLNRWMPVLVSGDPQAGDGVEQDELGTVERDDGGTQATYRGWPVYRFVDDEASGDVNGDEISDVWTSIEPGLEPVEDSTGLPAGEGGGQD